MIINVSSGFAAFEIMPTFYEYGYGFPFFNNVSILFPSAVSRLLHFRTGNSHCAVDTRSKVNNLRDEKSPGSKFRHIGRVDGPRSCRYSCFHSAGDATESEETRAYYTVMLVLKVFGYIDSRSRVDETYI